SRHGAGPVDQPPRRPTGVAGACWGSRRTLAIVPATLVAPSSSSPIPLVEPLRQVIDEPLALDELDTPGALVPQLSTQMFVRIARRLRDEHRLELLLPHATPEQLTGLLDIDGWNADRGDGPLVR